MSTQIFKKKIPREILYNFLDSCCVKKNNFYVFSKVSYKGAQFKNLISDFLQKIRDYYHTSKQIYIDRKMTYKNFITILRQICKNLIIPFTSTIKYDKSNYEIVYTIFTDFDK